MDRRNLLILMSDQHSRDAMSCAGHPVVRTPNLDKLAERGTRFTSAYTPCPICVPARASFATGQYVHQIGYWDNAHPYEGAVEGWGHQLIAAGHRVESIGKLHHRFDEDPDGYVKHHIPLNVVDGVGDVMSSLREDIPVRSSNREAIRSARGGESTYLDYDRRIADSAEEWLVDAARRKADGDDKPWAAFVSFVCPHPPYICPPDLFDEYFNHPDLPMPAQWRREDWPDHPALNEFRRVMQCDEPFSEEEIRRVMAAYYGATTWMDRQLGRVLDSLEANGLAGDTRIIYSSDHGESLGRRGLYGKFTMYEESAGVPLILSGPGVPVGQVCRTPANLIDIHQSALDCLGVEASANDASLPGRSLFQIVNEPDDTDRVAFSEYHAVASTSAQFMLRKGRHKLIHYTGQPPQLFNLEADPDEAHDLAGNTESLPVLQDLESELGRIVSPEEIDAKAKGDQAALIAQHGGREAVLAKGTFINSPAPGEKPAFVNSDSNESQ